MQSSAICFNLDQSKILSSGNELVSIAANWKDVCLQHTVNPINTIVKYGFYYDFMDR